MLKIISAIDTRLAKLEYLMITLLIAALTLILSTQVILRYFFNSPLFWAEEISVQILIATSFLGVSYLLYTKRLVKVDVVLLFLKEPYLRWLNMLLGLIALTTLLIMCYFATEWISRPEIRSEISPTTQLPRWYNYAVLVASFYTMTWHQFALLIKTFSEPLDNPLNSKEVSE